MEKDLNMISEISITRIYSGKVGCACGCLGKYKDEKFKTIFNNMKKFAEENKVRQFEGIDLDGNNFLSVESDELNKNYTVYYK